MSDDFAVGYGKPPKKSQWKKGQSGNSKGRPKGEDWMRRAKLFFLAVELAYELQLREELQDAEGAELRAAVAKKRAELDDSEVYLEPGVREAQLSKLRESQPVLRSDLHARAKQKVGRRHGRGCGPREIERAWGEYGAGKTSSRLADKPLGEAERTVLFLLQRLHRG